MARSNEPKDEADEPRLGRERQEPREFSNADWAAANAPTDPERRRKLRQRLEQTHLPNLPPREGWHRCWVSTSHSTDTVATRLNFGYKTISKKALQESGDWNPHQHSSKDADSTDDTVRWREMIGMELPEELYQELMRELHHDLPRDRAMSIYDPLAEIEERIRDSGGSMQMGDGFKEMAKFKRAPKQFE